MMRRLLTSLLLSLASGCSCGSSDAGPDAATSPLLDAGPLPSRLLTNSVIAGGPEFVSLDGFRDYLDAMQSIGIRDLHLFATLRNRCSACGAGGRPMDVDTWPAPGTYDFSWYFDRLDVAIREKGMRVILNINLSGRLDGDPQAPYAFVPTLPDHFGPDDLMMIRDASGADVVYLSPTDAKALAFAKPEVRAALLDYVTAVVTRFRARYGDWVIYYNVTTNTTSENEYPLAAIDSYTDTSPHAAADFRAWLAAHYASPAEVSTAWGRTPAFTDFAEIAILDGQPPPAIGEAPRAYLDFMAYREAALGSFLADVRDRVHDAGGRALAQYGSVFDWITPWRGSHLFGRQAAGYDLVLVDDAPGYPHAYSMDYVRTNGGGLPFGNEVDSPCSLGCASGDLASCCDQESFPDGIDPDLGATRMDAQVDQTYAGGAALVDLANWDFYYQSAFPLYQPSLAHAVALAQEERAEPVPVATQTISLRELYVHHGDPSYVDSLVEAHAALAQDGPVAVTLEEDLDP